MLARASDAAALDVAGTDEVAALLATEDVDAALLAAVLNVVLVAALVEGALVPALADEVVAVVLEDAWAVVVGAADAVALVVVGAATLAEDAVELAPPQAARRPTAARASPPEPTCKRPRRVRGRRRARGSVVKAKPPRVVPGQ
jgi:hypothetical protein